MTDDEAHDEMISSAADEVLAVIGPDHPSIGAARGRIPESVAKDLLRYTSLHPDDMMVSAARLRAIAEHVGDARHPHSDEIVMACTVKLIVHAVIARAIWRYLLLRCMVARVELLR